MATCRGSTPCASGVNRGSGGSWPQGGAGWQLERHGDALVWTLVGCETDTIRVATLDIMYNHPQKYLLYLYLLLLRFAVFRTYF